MSDDNKSMDVLLICNQYVVTYNKLLDIKPMGIIAPWAEYLEIISLDPVKKSRDKPNGP